MRKRSREEEEEERKRFRERGRRKEMREKRREEVKVKVKQRRGDEAYEALDTLTDIAAIHMGCDGIGDTDRGSSDDVTSGQWLSMTREMHPSTTETTTTKLESPAIATVAARVCERRSW